LDRELYALDAVSVVDVLASIPHGNDHFAAFLAWNAVLIPTEVISQLATELHHRGLAYLCVWGPGCERVHDIFDEVQIELEGSRPIDSVVMTTWHAEEPIEEALWFFVNNSFPDAAYEDTCCRGIAISIGNPEWAKRVAWYLSDLKALNSSVGV